MKKSKQIKNRTPNHFQQLTNILEPMAATAIEFGFSEQDFIDAASNAFFRILVWES